MTSTDHPVRISRRGARGVGVTVLAQVVTMLTQLVGTVLLARLLSPDAYGLLAMVTVLMAAGSLIRDFGMGTASLEADALDDLQASNLFWVNAALAGGTAACLALIAPLVSHVFGDTRLLLLVPVMSAVLFVTGLQTQYQARLARDLRFGALAIGTTSAAAVGLAVGVLGATSGWGYWALAAQQGSGALWLFCYYLVATKWTPSLPSRGVGSRSQVRAGAYYGLANVMGYLADNIDTFMIGLRWGPTPLGFYNRAFATFMQPITATFGPLTLVVVPTVRKLTGATGSASLILLKMQSALVGAATWGLVMVAATADWLIPALLGPQWLPMVPILRVLAVGGVPKVLLQVNYWAYVISAKPQQLFQSSLITKPIQIILVVIGAQFGVMGVAWAYVIGNAVNWPINLLWLSRRGGPSPWGMLANGLRLAWAAALSYSVAVLVLSAMRPALGDWPMVLIGAGVVAVAYPAAFLLTPGGWREARGAVSIGMNLVRRTA